MYRFLLRVNPKAMGIEGEAETMCKHASLEILFHAKGKSTCRELTRQL